MEKYEYFPMFINISGKRMLIVGGGKIAFRRVETLSKFACEIIVAAPEVCPGIREKAGKGELTLLESAFEPELLMGADYVFACTDDPEKNREITELAKMAGVPVNDCSDRSRCGFYFPAVLTSGDYVIGVTSGGKNHSGVKQMRQMIEKALEETKLLKAEELSDE